MSAYDKQVGGKHYIKYKVQPSKFVTENKLLYPEGSVIKYVIRHQDKGGKEDLEKAKHMIDMIIERDYGPKESWIDGYNKWKELSRKGVINNKVKLGDLKKERCPHN